ncbi:MAG: CoA transferase, partial [Gammaproteobacteria bacterium]
MGSTSAALAGLRVLDLGAGPACGLATMILADFGAEVLTVVRPGAEPFAELAARPMWMRGKRTLELDLDAPDDRARLDGLLGAVDVLVINWRTAALVRQGLAPDTLRQRWPDLIIAHVSGFGDRGPLAHLPGYEHLVAAKAGRMRL